MSGTVRILWEESKPASVSITGGGTWSVGGSPITFPYTLSSSTTFVASGSGTCTVSVLFLGQQIADTPDRTRTVELSSTGQTIIRPSLDGLLTDGNRLLSLVDDYVGGALATPGSDAAAAAGEIVAAVTDPIQAELDGRLSESSLTASNGQPAAATGGNDTALLTAALAAYDTVTLPFGSTYLVTALTVPAGKTLNLNDGTIKKHSGTSSLITMSANATLRNGTLDGNNLAGSAVRIAVADALVENVYATNSADTGFDMNAATRPVLRNCSSYDVKYGLLLNNGTVDGQIIGGHHRTNRSTEFYAGAVYLPNASRCVLVDVVVTSAGHTGFYDMGTGNTFTGCVARDCGTALTDQDPRGACTDGSTDSTWTGCSFLGNGECGFYDRDTSTGTRISNCLSAGNNTLLRPGGYGFEMNGSRYTLSSCTARGGLGTASDGGGGFFIGGNGGRVTGCESYLNNWHGFNLYDAQSASVSACHAQNNGVGAANSDGFNLNGSYLGGLKNVTITGCHAEDTRATKLQRYGCAIATNPQNYVIVGNIFRDAENLTGGFVDTSAGPKQVANNITA